MTEVRRLTVDLSGQLDQTALEQLRDALGLHRRGRLTDLEDWEFGFRALDGDGAAGMLRLWRYDDLRWAITLDAADAVTPSDAEVVALAEQAERAAAQAGLTTVDRTLGAPERTLVRLLFVLLRGQLDAARLATLRGELGVSTRGDLADEREWDFGERMLGNPAVTLRLTRLRPDTWAVAVEAEPSATVDPDELDRWAATAADAARAVGLDPATPAR
jgi:hypothetical protein